MATTDAERRLWTQQGAQDAAQATYAAVKRAIENSPDLDGKAEVFLQGSYANHTNTRGDSDVDVVVKSATTVFPVTSLLTPAERARERAAAEPAAMTFLGFRKLVEQALVDYFGSQRVHPKEKCLRVDKRAGYVDADVVPAFEVQRYTSYPPSGAPDFIEGIAIKPLSGGDLIINYPKEHRANGASKNEECEGRYKPTVRQVKRLRRKAVDAGLFDRKAAPGYLLECMVFNVPTDFFDVDDSQRLLSVMRWLWTRTTPDFASQFLRFKACDEIHHLFIDDPGNHDPGRAAQVISTMARFM
jgi:hypothetical protein